MHTPVPSPVASGDRLITLDVVRGLAVLGILVMNIVEFGLPMHSYGNPAIAGGTEGVDLWVWLMQSSLFDGRMRALFSMLFGAGLVLIGERMLRSGRGDMAADVLLRRCLWLIPFGIVHRFFLQWTGDILYIYGLFGVLAVAFRKLRSGTLLVLGVVALTVFVPIELRKYSRACELRADAAAATELEDEGAEVPPELRRARARWDRRLQAPDPEANEDEIAAMRGSWVDVVRHRWDHNHAFQHAYICYYFVWDVFGMILIGMGLSGLGFFAGRMRTSVYVTGMLLGAASSVVSWRVAQAWAASGWSRGEIDLLVWRDSTYAYLRGLTGLGWASALILVLRATFVAALLGPLASVGRMAFTNYILQTVCCTVFFFGWGLGYFAEFSRSQLMLVVAAVSLLQIVTSVMWLRWFRFGPLEWMWRSLIYWRRQPMRVSTDD